MIGDFRQAAALADRIGTEAVAVETGNEQQMSVRVDGESARNTLDRYRLSAERVFSPHR